MPSFPTSSAEAGEASRRRLTTFSQTRPHERPPTKANEKAERHVRRLTEWSRDRALEWFISTTEAMRERALAGTEHWSISEGLRRRLHTMFGVGAHTPNLLASNMATRVIAGCWFVAWLLTMYADNLGRSFYHATFFDDRQRTHDRDTQLDLRKIGKPVRALLAEHGIRDWFGVIELQPYTNWRAGVGRDIAPHTHVILWSDIPLDIHKLEASLARSKRLVSFTNAPTVKISERRGIGNLAHMAAYLFKGPERGANLVEGQYRRSGRSATYDARMRSDQAVRVMEILSHFNLSEFLLSSGEGLQARSELVKELRRLRVGQDLRQEARARHAPGIWRRARRRAGKTAYQPVRVVRGGATDSS